MAPVSAADPVDASWLCAVALYEYGWGEPEEVAASSLAWLPTAPVSGALFHLADDTLAGTTRSEDVQAWIEEVFADLLAGAKARLHDLAASTKPWPLRPLMDPIWSVR